MGVISSVWKPDTESNTEKKLADDCEVTNLKLAASGGAAVVSLYDSKDSSGAVYSNLKWVLDASTEDVDEQKFEGLVFKRGVYAVLEQGENFNAIICVTRKHYEV